MTKKQSPHATMLNLMIGHWVSRLIQVAAKLKLADLLKDRDILPSDSDMAFDNLAKQLLAKMLDLPAPR